MGALNLLQGGTVEGPLPAPSLLVVGSGAGAAPALAVTVNPVILRMVSIRSQLLLVSM